MSVLRWTQLGLGITMILAGVAAIVREYHQWSKEIDRDSRRYDDWQ